MKATLTTSKGKVSTFLMITMMSLPTKFIKSVTDVPIPIKTYFAFTNKVEMYLDKQFSQEAAGTNLPIGPTPHNTHSAEAKVVHLAVLWKQWKESTLMRSVCPGTTSLR